MIVIGASTLFLRTYIKKRAEGLATTKDIENITEKVESIKSLYAQELEALRSELSYSNWQRQGIKEKEHEVLLTFLEDCLIIIHEKLNYDIGIISFNETHLIWEYEKSIHTLFAKIRVDYNKLLIYFPKESTLIKSAINVVDASIATQAYVKREFYDVARVLLTGLVILKKQQEPENGVTPPSSEVVNNMRDSANRAVSIYYMEINPLLKTFDEAVDEYVKILQEHFGQLIKPNNALHI